MAVRPHQAQLELSGLAAGDYRILVDGKAAPQKIADSRTSKLLILSIGAATIVIEKAD